MAIQQKDSTLAPISSETDIQILTSQVQQLDSKHSFWNAASVWFTAAIVIAPLVLYPLALPAIWFLALSAIAPALYFFAIWMANRRGLQQNAAQAALIRAKDEQFAREKLAADEKIASANLGSAKASEGAAKANERAEKLEQENLLLRKALLELQERLEPRKLSYDQRRKLEDALMVAPKGAIKVECVRTPDNEPYTFALELAHVLMVSGWQVSSVTSVDVLGTKKEGIELYVPNTAPQYTVELQKILESIGFPTLLARNADPARTSVTLFVGMK
jgi:hypothetical protein